MSKPWQIVAMLFVIASVNYADRSAITAVFPLLRAELGLSDLALAATGSLFLWGYALGSPLAGRLADRVSRANMVVVSLAAWSLVTFITGLVTSGNQLLAVRLLLGIAECAYLPAAVALIADHHSTKSRGTAMGIHLAGLNFGLVVGGALAGYAGEQYGWRLGFFILGGVGLLLAAVARFVLVDSHGGTAERIAAGQSTGEALRILLRVPSYWIEVIQAMMIAVGVWIFINWLPLYFRETFQLGLGSAGFSGAFMIQGAATLGIMVGGYLSDRIAGTRLRRRMLFQAICYLIGAPFLLMFLAKPAYLVLSLCIFAFSFCRALGASNEHAIVCDLLPAHLRSTAVGLMNTTNCLAGGVGILVAGYLKQSLGLSGIFTAISGIVILAALLVLCGYRFFLPRDLSRRTHLEEESTSWALSPQPIPPSAVSRKTAT